MNEVIKESDSIGPSAGSLGPEFHFTLPADASPSPGLQTQCAWLPSWRPVHPSRI